MPTEPILFAASHNGPVGVVYETGVPHYGEGGVPYQTDVSHGYAKLGRMLKAPDRYFSEKANL